MGSEDMGDVRVDKGEPAEAPMSPTAKAAQQEVTVWSKALTSMRKVTEKHKPTINDEFMKYGVRMNPPESDRSYDTPPQSGIRRNPRTWVTQYGADLNFENGEQVGEVMMERQEDEDGRKAWKLMDGSSSCLISSVKAIRAVLIILGGWLLVSANFERLVPGCIEAKFCK